MAVYKATVTSQPWQWHEWRPAIFGVLTFMVFFVLYYFLTLALVDDGFLHPYLLFFGEKSLLALKGTPPRLENIGFIYPPLPVFMAIVFKADVLIAQGFVSAAISAYILKDILNACKSNRTALILIGYLILSFPLVFLATQRFDLYLHLFLIILSLKFLNLYIKSDYSLNLFLSGPILGLTFFVHFNTIYLMPLFVILLAILYRSNLKKLIAVALVLITPYFIFFMMFAYLNWIFTGDGFGFLANYKLMFSNQDVTAVVSAESVTGSFVYMLKYMLRVLPVIAPCLVAMYYGKKLLSVAPFLIIFSAIYSNLFYPSIYVSAVFIIYFFMLTDFGAGARRGVMTTLIVVSIISSAALAFISNDEQESGFTRIFAGKSADSLRRYRATAEILSRTDGKILADDTELYPLIYIMRRPDRFILPYRYEFVPALSNPSAMVNYAVVLKNSGRDRVLQKYEHGIKGFHSFFEDEGIIIWERNGFLKNPAQKTAL